VSLLPAHSIDKHPTFAFIVLLLKNESFINQIQPWFFLRHNYIALVTDTGLYYGYCTNVNDLPRWFFLAAATLFLQLFSSNLFFIKG
jgi:hypothetical protein